MADVISRQAAIDEVNRLAEFFWEKWHEYAPSTIAVTDALKEMPSAQQWIPCSEKLPEEGQEVLFSTKTGTVQIGKYSDRGCLNSWFSYCDKCRAWNNVVNAWMPLPEPYRGGE